jgi:TonB family protein
MSDSHEPSALAPAGDPRAADKAALWWLARWIGLPLLVVIGIYQAEPLIRGWEDPEFVPVVTQQQVQAYPFDENTKGPSLAPPDIPPLAPLPFPALPGDPAARPATTPAEIVAQPLEQPQPRYPRRALEREKEGVVRVRLTIGPDGTVSEAVVVASQPAGLFDDAALEAVRRWRYQAPGRALVTEAVIEFKLD